MKQSLLSDEARQDTLNRLQGWTYEEAERAITRRFRFRDYAEAFAFVTRVSLLAERLDHHPDIRFGWGYAELRLTTHDAGGITERDVVFAEKVGEW